MYARRDQKESGVDGLGKHFFQKALTLGNTLEKALYFFKSSLWF